MRNGFKRMLSGAPGKTILIVLAALAFAAAVECLFNVRSFQTAGLLPEALDMEDFSCFDDAVTVDENGAAVSLTQNESRHVDLIYYGLDTELNTVSVELNGQGAVNVSFYIKDESGYYEDQFVYGTYCVAQDPGLRYCCAPVRSAGLANELTLRFTSAAGANFTVLAVTVNAPIPFAWSPVRAALSFAVALALLCFLFFKRLRSLRYDPRKRAHRLIVVLPLVGIMVFSCVVSAWIQPDAKPLAGVTDEEALADTTDAYAVLFETLRSGRLSLAQQPGDDLLSLGNPYDNSERIRSEADYLFDYVLYGNQYYVYFGLAPILTVYEPFHLLTGRVPTARDACLLLSLLAIALVGWAVCGLARRYVPQTNVFALSMACVTAVFASGVPFLAASAAFYYTAELSFVCFCAGSVAFGLHASLQKRRWLRLTQYALSGLCFALTLMSRANAIPMLIAFLAPLFLFELFRKRAGVREAAAFLVPALAGAALVMAYNQARFGSVFEFGATYQLTLSDVQFQRVTLSEWPLALYHYLFEPIRLQGEFPYLALVNDGLSAAGRSVYLSANAGVFAVPVTWAAFLSLVPVSRPEAAPRGLEAERRWVYGLPLLACLPVMLVSYGIAGAMLRYTCDFRLFFSLAGVACMLPFFRRTDSTAHKIVKVVFLALCVASILIGVGLVFDNENDLIRFHSPQVFYGLQRMLFPY